MAPRHPFSSHFPFLVKKYATVSLLGRAEKPCYAEYIKLKKKKERKKEDVLLSSNSSAVGESVPSTNIQ